MHQPYIQVKPDIVCTDHEQGQCTMGHNCRFAHGEYEREANNQLYISQRINILGEKYKTQHCRSFTREKYCAFGQRCHYTHEKRTLIKLHRHYYQMHLATMKLKNQELLDEALGSIEEE